MKLFRDLNEDEKAQSRKWARENYKPFEPISGVWHPVVQEECARMNAEQELSLEEAERVQQDEWERKDGYKR